ncbi:MAG: competence protein ComK [Erysipelotrichaceae bacterium]|nr:competence protein ComK [Erysipelotrichaceae bacterium]
MNELLFMLYDYKQRKLYLRYADHSATSLETIDSFIDRCCLSNGSSMRGRIAGSRHHLGMISKPPVIVNRECCLFPLFGRMNPNNIWFNYQLLEKTVKLDEHLTKVIFKNQLSLIINVNIRIIRQQVSRCHQLLGILNHFNYN